MATKKLSFKGLWHIIKNSFSGFSNDNVTKLSASLAYYTMFSMGPLLVMIIALCGVFLGRDAIEGKIYTQLQQFLGPDTALQLQQIIKNAFVSGKGNIAIIIGSISLLIGATSVFAEMQDSINRIWGLKPKPKRGWVKMLQNRFLSFSVIISLGFLLLVSLAVASLVEALSNRLKTAYPGVTVVVLYIINLVITMGITSLIFAVIFKVLPDAKIRWRDVIAGSITTAILFMLGKFGISFYIGKSHVGTTYGAAGSLVVLLLWIYYSSIILYLGAEFTKAYAVEYGSPIMPSEYAVTTKTVEVETGHKTVQDKENADTKVKVDGAEAKVATTK